jgi:hypothetical protein
VARTLTARSPSISKAAQLVDVTDLTGGLDLRRSPTLLGANRAQTLVNWELTNPGQLTVRPGHVQQSTSSLGGTRIQGAARVYLSSETFSVVAYDGAIYRPTDTGAWGSAVYSTLNSTVQVFFPYDRDLVAVFDGVNDPYKSTNGTAWTHFGISPSSTNSTLAQSASSGSLLANEYEIGFTYRETVLGHESNGGVISTITLGTTGAIDVEVHGSTDPQVGTIRFYARNKSAGETVRRLISTATNQTNGSTVGVKIQSSNWSGAVAEPTDHTIPPVLSFGVPWKNRWWARHATIGNRLHFTQIFQQQSWPATFFLDIPFATGDSITAIKPVGDTLLIFGDSGIFLVIGQTSLDFDIRPALDAQDGALGPRAVAESEHGVIHAGGSGIWLFDGATDRLLSFDIEPAWRDLLENAAQVDLDRVAITYHAFRKEVRVAVSRRYPTAEPGEFILDLNQTRESQTPAWAATDRDIGGYQPWDGAEVAAGDRGKLFSWTTTTGILNQEATGKTANSSNITSEYHGPAFSLGMHRARITDLRGEYEPHGGALTVETLVDGLSQGQRSVGIGTGLAVYGAAVYGTGIYAGTGRRMFHHMLPLAAEGRTVSQKLNYSGQESFKQFTYAWEIRPEKSVRSFSD